ncbi:hypothetical protein POM88_009697 [Heracleum sosnowskyi]|uniref:Uncharacterized protein n=1 Tax=Heracleum sosnowskyi TaxID=360622 RepID=A0AAD8J987_9APIA|nr:hypothetical protein POM88_009697 [Heracleum sosnowskyi]
MAGNYPGYEVCSIYGDYETTYSSKTFRAKHENKQNGSYERFTAKDKKVSHEPFVDKSSGCEGYKDEHTKTSTYKTGDKNGYTEYHREVKVKVKHVDYGKCNNNNKAKRSYYDSSSKKNNYKRVKWSYDQE